MPTTTKYYRYHVTLCIVAENEKEVEHIAEWMCERDNEQAINPDRHTMIAKIVPANCKVDNALPT